MNKKNVEKVPRVTTYCNAESHSLEFSHSMFRCNKCNRIAFGYVAIKRHVIAAHGYMRMQAINNSTGIVTGTYSFGMGTVR